jgi:serine/threonine protein kinase
VTDPAPGDPARRLQRLWQQGQRPDLAAFLAEAGQLTPDQLLAVVRLDQQQRWLAGERVGAEAYLNAHPALRADPEGAVVLVFGEFVLRERLGERPADADYLRRFPEYADALGLQFELHEGLPEEPATEVPAAPSGWPGVPGFELLRELGRGATSVVYQVRQADTGRVVALKLARGDLVIGRPERARFRSEGEAVARLRHPNVVRILDIGEWDRRPFLVLEFVAGGSVAERLAAGPLPVADAVRLVEVVARTVHHAHERGVIHRDLNPANVLLAADGTPKVTDFGLAKLLAGGTGLTRTGAVLGTPAYMAPEQASGRAREVGPATDVHGLGAVLYHLLTGRPPYVAGDVIGTLVLIRSPEPPPPVRGFRPEVPAEVEAVCLRCLAKRPADRYPSALAVAEALARGAEGRRKEDRGQTEKPARSAGEGSSSSVRSPQGPHLRSEAGECFPLTRPVTVLGRSPECDLRLPGRTVSRRHCRVRREGDGAVVDDLDSTQGTWVNGGRVRSAALRDGDRLEVGGRVFWFHAGG